MLSEIPSPMLFLPEDLRNRDDRLKISFVDGAEATRRGWVRHDLLLENIRYVHGVYRRSPRDRLVVAHYHEGHAGEAAADRINAATIEMDGIKRGWGNQREMRIVG